MTNHPIVSEINAAPTIADIERLDQELTEAFRDVLITESAMTRRLVSFQANKTQPIARWYKYKEAFSDDLVNFFLQELQIRNGTALDPFAGIGTTLFAASALGLNADGIELLPIGQQVISSRLMLTQQFTNADFERLEYWITHRPWIQVEIGIPLQTLRITNGAYPAETLAAIEHYLACIGQENTRVQNGLRFALLCILESISFTRKDGQYLRWDYRSGRKQGKKAFNKGKILDFERAITSKLSEIVADLRRDEYILPFFQPEPLTGNIRLYNGSCIDLLPTLPDEYYDAVITSPPYCNRYDYTRTYALELALLGVDEKGIVSLRQQLLSCTVENRPKDLTAINPAWTDAVESAQGQTLLQAILRYLNTQNERGQLNNKGIPRMVRGYFYEMACVIAECARVLKPGAPLVMVNDNVRYAGVSISVDLILSQIASNLGFSVERILVLPTGKGNSSQQMGRHGRDTLRKCVYVWRKA